MSTPTPYDWIREIPSALKLLDDIPLLGYPPNFPIEDFSSKLGQLLQIPQLSIQLSSPEWKVAEDLVKGLPDDLIPTNIAVSPLEGTITLVFSKQDIISLFASMASTSTNALMLDNGYLEGFYRFITLEAVNIFQGLDFDKALAPQVLASKDLPTENSLCWDIAINIPNRQIHGRLIVSQTFRTKWKERFSQRTLNVPTSITQKVDVTVHIEAGHTTLKLNDWREVAPGDFIILDHCTMVPGDEKGRVMLTLNGKPTFRARIKQGSLKILEYPMFYEVDTPMAKLTPEESEEDFEDEEITDSEMEGEESEAGIDESIEEEEDFEEEDEALEQDRPSLAEAPQPRSTETHAAPTPEDIPVTLVVEVGRFQISVQKLMELQPGNILELNVRPENGIDLVINGRCVGKGELLKIGDALGVRILDMVT